MRRLNQLLLLAIAVVTLSTGLLLAFPFHDSGVADCQGCHTMHNSQDGVPIDPDSATGNPWLLTDATASDVCLGCHATGLGAVLSIDPLAPDPEKGSGNFTFLYEDNLNDGHNGASNPIDGDAAGHNLVAPGYSLSADATLTSAPGGSYPAAVMGCTGCHDPHGTTDFRLLYGAGRQIAATGNTYTFVNPAPDAEGISIFFGSESNSNHTAYKSGMSAWCGNCHGDFHANGASLIHKSGTTFGATVSTTYNLYNGTSDQTGGDQTTAYLADVPFEDPANTTSSTAGPLATSQVSCISCHRAHATSAVDSGRWDFQVTFLHEDSLESGSYPIPDPYNDLNQRSLCNKCHGQDQFDELPF
jgi:predicted CXXCH cytochrome family protein